jgi:uncharacterized membrane protein
MAFCSNCGASVDGRFCGKCGTPNPLDPTAPAATPRLASTNLTDNLAGALCYALGLVTGILFLVLAPYNQNRTVRFHAFQSIFLHLAAFLSTYVLRLVLIGGLPFLGGFLGLIFPVIWLGFVVLWLYVMVSTYQGKKIVLPVIGPLAEQQA